ncbi:MAG: hypothetical protein U9P72_07905, partial [Campylobacterota bacterium]|nr:hypothetical protein [Campylobacterota bacterium]
MKRYIVLILLTLAPLFLQANTSNINECISDIYFANSIMTIKDDADKYKDLIKKKVLKEQYNNDLSKMDKELNFKTSYNRTHGYYKDIYDTYMFVSSEEDGWDTYKKIISLFLDKGIGKVIGKVTNLSKKEEELLDKLLDSIDLQNHVDIYDVDRNADLSKQIKDYRDSIRLGHSIVIVAHGKGDIFTAKAYEEMLKPEGARENGWLAEYVNWMSVGSPTREVRDTYINFDNDSLPYVGTLETKNNPNRSFTQNAVGEVFENNFDMQFHSFNYYMGEPILFQDGLGKRNISTDIGKKMIMNFLKNSIKKHRDAYSQWALDQEYNKNTKANRITVKHLHDS